MARHVAVQELQNSQKALTKLEQLSDQQGSGQITLFFGEGSASLDQQQRLIRFLDYISRDSRGRKVILVSVGDRGRRGVSIKVQSVVESSGETRCA
jgi:hypothetical protein